MITVLDADPASKTYGALLSALTVDSSGLMPHHIEYSLPAKGPLFANDYTGDKSFLIDFSTPLKPRLSARLAPVPGGRRVHTFIRLPSGNVLATYQFGDTLQRPRRGQTRRELQSSDLAEWVQRNGDAARSAVRALRGTAINVVCRRRG